MIRNMALESFCGLMEGSMKATGQGANRMEEACILLLWEVGKANGKKANE